MSDRSLPSTKWHILLDLMQLLIEWSSSADNVPCPVVELLESAESLINKQFLIKLSSVYTGISLRPNLCCTYALYTSSSLLNITDLESNTYLYTLRHTGINSKR